MNDAVLSARGLNKRFGAVVTYQMGKVFSACGFTGLAFAHHEATWSIATLCIGLGAGLTWPVTDSLVAAFAPEDKKGSFLIRPYRPTYILLGRWSNSPNRQPTSANPANTVSERMDVDPVEAKYQISFKTKLWEGLFGRHGDLWLGYTQQSNWQVYNKRFSSPFRETDYEPELMSVFRTNLDVGAGFKVSMMSLGLNHQSNGRSQPLSRSWNRLMAQVGIERGNFAVVIRPWLRLSEKAEKDDNPDITTYLGHGDIQAMWQLGEHDIGLNLRGPLLSTSKSRGSAQLDWGFPIHRNLKGYVQLFSGYGETLIDYNHRQNVIGFGVSLVDWM